MRVYLADLAYLNDWDTNQPIPLNVGYIAAYLRQQRPGDEIEIFKDPGQLLTRLAAAPPDLLGMSHYDWNSNLNLPLLKEARHLKPDLVTILGGPNFHAGDERWMAEFFTRRPDIDAYLTGEGERSFAMAADLIDRHGTVAAIPWESRPASMFAFDASERRVIHNPTHVVPRLDLSTVPSPYLNGLLDRFLHDARLAPIIETNRGCPYSCTYCCWGQATQSKINQFPLDVVKEEIRHAVRETRNSTGFFYIADGNFGILARDQEIAETLQDCTARHGLPKRVYVYFAKNTNERVMQIAEKMSSISAMSMSKQTLNPVALENVKRKNIPVAQYDQLREECERRGIVTYSELIYSLAGESDDSYIDGVITTIRSGQRVTMYPQLLLAGSESGEKHYREKFGLQTAFRVIPRCVGSYGTIHSLEYEEVVVAHNEMTRDGYLRIRLFQFLVTLLAGQAFQEFNKALTRAGLDYGTLANLLERGRAARRPAVAVLFDQILAAARRELIEKAELKLHFTAEDIEGVKANELALVPYFQCVLASSAETMKQLRADLQDLVDSRFGGRVAEGFAGELSTGLAVAFDKLVCYDPPVQERMILHEYDFDAWLAATSGEPLETFRMAAPVPYVYKLEDGVVEALARSTEALRSPVAALYRVRFNLIGKLVGDRVFCYQRKTAAAEQRDYKAAVDAAHANLAARN
jgi:hypothetical protein